jgi:hypothetical protein
VIWDQTAWEERIEQEAALQPRDRTEFARPTPSVVIEAIWLCVRERGIAALAQPANQERLTRCDDKARAELERRIEKLGAAR